MVSEDAVAITLDHITIDRRFCGPPTSGNGGYVCGRLAHYVGDQATVRLMQPPPLDTSLEVRKSGDTVELRDGESIIARAWPEGRDVEPPPAPGLESALAVRETYAGLKRHVFPSCFVCGPHREEGDGLRIFPGRLAGEDTGRRVACDWTPHENLCVEDGTVLPHFIWAALDCPSGWASLTFDDIVGVLGELSVQIHEPVHCGKTYVVMGWEIAAEGRKRFTGSALYSADGEVLATGRATWIVIEPT